MELKLAFARIVNTAEPEKLAETLKHWAYPHQHEFQIFAQQVQQIENTVTCTIFIQTETVLTRLEKTLHGDCVMKDVFHNTYKEIEATIDLGLGRLILENGSSRSFEPVQLLLETAADLNIVPVDIDPMAASKIEETKHEPRRVTVKDFYQGRELAGRYEAKALYPDETVLAVVEDCQVSEYTFTYMKGSSITLRANGTALIRDREDPRVLLHAVTRMMFESE